MNPVNLFHKIFSRFSTSNFFDYTNHNLIKNPFYNTIYKEFSNRKLSEKEFCILIIKFERLLCLEIEDFLISSTLQKGFLDAPVKLFPIYQPRCINCYKDKQYFFASHPIKLKDIEPTRVNIGVIPTLSPIWNADRLKQTLSNITVLGDNSFKFQPLNHMAKILSPFDIVLFGNGNHSSCAGIFEPKADIFIEEIIDFSSWYEEIYFDGTCFRHKCGKKLFYPIHNNIGIIFEIGRLIGKYNINLFNYVISNDD